MRLTPNELDRLTIFTAAELARRRRARGLRLSQPEAVAVICDALHEAARDGLGYDAVVAAGRAALTTDDVLDGVAELVGTIRLEVLLADGSRIVHLEAPIGPHPGGPAGHRPR